MSVGQRTRRTPLRRGQHVLVREVAWEEIAILDDRKYLEIASTDFPEEARRLEEVCECGAALVFVRAETWMLRPETCCCGGCRAPALLVIGACPGCGCDDCASQEPCPAIGEEMGFVYEGEEVRLFFDSPSAVS